MLTWAVRYNQKALAEFLLGKGVKPTAKIVADAVEVEAQEAKESGVLAVLIQHNPKLINAPHQGEAPLQRATRLGKPQAIALLSGKSSEAAEEASASRGMSPSPPS